MKFKSNIEVQAGIEDKDGQVGSNGQILASTGSQVDWVDPANIVTSATDVIIECKNTSGVTIAKGTPVYQTGNVGATAVIEVAVADASDEDKMAAIGLLQSDLINNAFGYVVVTGELLNITTSPIDGVTPTTGDTIYVKPGGGLTLTKPTGVNFIQNVGLVGKVSGGNAGSLTVSSIMRSNDVPTPLYIDHDNQRLGIGTPTPGSVLDVQGTQGQLFSVTDDLSGEIFAVADISGVPIMTVNSSGLSTFAGNVSITKGVLSITSDGLNAVTFTESGSGDFTIDAPDDIRLDAGGGDIVLKSAGTEYGRISKSSSDLSITSSATDSDILINPSGNGNVGIGTTSPGAKLEVVGNTTITGAAGTTLKIEAKNNTAFNDPRIEFVTWNVASGASSGRIQLTNGTFNSNDMAFFTETGNSVTEKMRIDSDGNVGIGTTSPGSRLTVSGTNNATSEITLINTNPSTDNDWSITPFYNDQTLRFRTNSAATTVMTLKDNGNVGIGTTSPSKKLTVYGGNDNGIWVDSSGSQYTSIAWGNNGTEKANIAYDNTNANFVLSAYGASDTVFSNNGSEKMRIDSAGNVGIGTTSPQSGGGSARWLSLNGTAAYSGGIVYTVNSATKAYSYFESDYLKQQAQSGFGQKFIVNGTTTAMTILSNGNATFSGNVAVNGTNVTVANASNPYIYINDTNAGAGIFQQEGNTTRIGSDSNTQVVLVQNNATAVTIDTGKNVGINTTSPDFKLDVDGTFGVSDLPFNTDSVSVLVADETIASEIITNGGFDTDLTDWTNSSSYPWTSATWTSSGVSLQTSGSAQYKSFYQDIGPIISGKTYKISYSAVKTSGTMRVGVETAPVGSTVGYGKSLTSSEVVSEIFTATATNANCVISFWGQNDSSTNEWVIDNVSIKEVTSASNQIQKRELGTGAFGPTPVGAYLPLTGGTLTGNLTLSSTSPILYLNNTTSTTGKNWRLSSAANGKMYITQDGVIDAITLEHTSGNATFAGTVTFNDHTIHLDQVKSKFGTGGDAAIEHNGSHLFIDNSTGTSYFRNTASGGSGILLRNSTIGDIQFDNEFAGNILFNTSNIERMRIDSSGNVGIGTTSPSEKLVVDGKVIINNTTPPNNLAQLNIGSTSGGETRAIDIDGNWTAGESKSITFAYGYNDTHMVGQINCVFNSSTDSRLRWGKLYHGGATSTYTMELKSTSATTADLTVAGSINVNTNGLINFEQNTDIDTGAEVVAQVAHATYTAAFFDFVVKKGTNVRSGTVYACHNGDSTPLVEFTETSTNDLGDTSDVTLSVDISGANMRLLATVTSDDWSVKSLIRAI